MALLHHSALIVVVYLQIVLLVWVDTLTLGILCLLVVRRGGVGHLPPCHSTWRRCPLPPCRSTWWCSAPFVSSSFDAAALGTICLLVVRRGGVALRLCVVRRGGVALRLCVVRRGGVGQPSPPRLSTWRCSAASASSSFDVAAFGSLCLVESSVRQPSPPCLSTWAFAFLASVSGCRALHAPPCVGSCAQEGICPPRALLPLLVVAFPAFGSRCVWEHGRWDRVTSLRLLWALNSQQRYKKKRIERRRTARASHRQGPPCSSSLPYPSVERKAACPHPSGEGRGNAWADVAVGGELRRRP
jgi:hypothetical protein